MHGELSRRGLIGGALLLGGGAMLPIAVAASPGTVVAFHADQLYLDRSDRAVPYAPPPGLRGLEGQDEALLRYLVYGL